MYFLTTIH